MKNFLLNISKQSFIADYIGKGISFTYNLFPYFFITLTFLLSLLFVSSNLTLLITSIIFSFVLYQKTKNLELTIFLGLITTLPFAKGKTFELILLENNQVSTNSLFDIDYSFPIYLSDIFLFALIWVLIRNKNIVNKIKNFNISTSQTWFVVFILITIVSGFFSKFPIVSLLSSAQILRLLLLMVIPLIINSKIKIKTIIETTVASVLFQTLLIFLQKINNGTLGIYIESFMLKEEFGIRSNENIDILRLTGSFFEPSILGTFLLINFSLLLNSLKKLKNNKIKKLVLLALLGCFIGIILTASRGIYLLFFAYIIYEIILVVKNRNLKLKTINKNLLLAIIIIVAVFLPYFSNRIFDFSKIFSKLGSGTYRLQLAEESFLLAKNNLLGVGINLSPYNFAIQKFSKEIIFDPAHPHNIFFQILAETGFIGLTIFSFFIFYTIKEIPQLNKNLFFYPIILFLIAAQFYPIFINQSEITSYLFLFIGLSKKYSKS